MVLISEKSKCYATGKKCNCIATLLRNMRAGKQKRNSFVLTVRHVLVGALRRSRRAIVIIAAGYQEHCAGLQPFLLWNFPSNLRKPGKFDSHLGTPRQWH